MTRRARAVPAAALAVALMGAAPATTAAQTPERWTLWARTDDAGFLQPLCDEYNRTHADQVTLSLIVAQQLVQKFAAAYAAGTAPDAISLDLVYVPAFAAAGVLRDISAWADALPFRNALPPTHLAQGRWRDRTWALPFSAEGSVMFYNRTLFRRAGLDPDRPPTDWASLVDDAVRIHALSPAIHGFFFSAGCGGCQVFEFTPFVWASGGNVLVDDGRRSTLATDPVLRATGLYRTLVRRAGVPPDARIDNGGYAITGFATGRVGIENLGAFGIGVLDAKYKTLDYGVAPIPGEHGGHSSFAGGDDIAICAPSRHAAAIERFMSWSWTLPAQHLLAAHGSLPVRTDLAGQALAGLDPRLAVSERGMQEGRTPYSVVFNDLFNNSNGPWATAIGRAIYGPDPAAALRRGQFEMQQIIDREGPTP